MLGYEMCTYFSSLHTTIQKKKQLKCKLACTQGSVIDLVGFPMRVWYSIHNRIFKYSFLFFCIEVRFSFGIAHCTNCCRQWSTKYSNRSNNQTEFHKIAEFLVVFVYSAQRSIFPIFTSQMLYARMLNWLSDSLFSFSSGSVDERTNT